jgi:hypothetical protein
MLMTEPVHERTDASIRERSSSHPLELDDVGSTATFYVDLERYVGEVPEAQRLPMHARIARSLTMVARSWPAMLGIRRACAGFRNLQDASSVAAS